MDRASQALAQGVPPGVPASYRAFADRRNVPRSTLNHRACRRRSIEEKAQSQQYLYPWEEDVVVKYLLQMSDLGQPIQMKFVPLIAFSVTRQRPAVDKAGLSKSSLPQNQSNSSLKTGSNWVARHPWRLLSTR
jgi:hypothetical protein